MLFSSNLSYVLNTIRLFGSSTYYMDLELIENWNKRDRMNSYAVWIPCKYFIIHKAFHFDTNSHIFLKLLDPDLLTIWVYQYELFYLWFMYIFLLYGLNKNMIISSIEHTKKLYMLWVLLGSFTPAVVDCRIVPLEPYLCSISPGVIWPP